MKASVYFKQIRLYNVSSYHLLIAVLNSRTQKQLLCVFVVSLLLVVQMRTQSLLKDIHDSAHSCKHEKCLK